MLNQTQISLTDVCQETLEARLERNLYRRYLLYKTGGQHRNKVETGVRLLHRPTGITVTATERRSQHANREAAFERMQTRLEEFQRVEIPRKPTRPTAASRKRRISEKRVSGLRKKLRSTPAEE